MKVIQNGSLLNQSESICDEKGWMAGTGIFETIKTVDNKPWALSRHMRRAVSSALREDIKVPSQDEVLAALELLFSHQSFENGALRLSFGADGNWAASHMRYEVHESSAKLITYRNQAPALRHPMKQFPYNYRLDILDSVKAQGADEAAVINAQGRVTEGAVTNILFFLDGQWITPPISDGVLPGVMRALVIEYCGVQVRSISDSDLPRVESGFLLSSLRIAQPIASIDGKDLMQTPQFRSKIEAMAVKTSVG